MAKSAEDLVRVKWGTMNDGLAGLMWRDGLSDPVVRYRAENLCLLLGPDASIVEPEDPSEDSPPSPPTPAAPKPPAEPVEPAREAAPPDAASTALAAADVYASVAESAGKAAKAVTDRAPRRR